MTNLTCPRTQHFCFDCTEPCKAPEINQAATAMPAAEKPFLGILAPIAETLGFQRTNEGITKITITTKL